MIGLGTWKSSTGVVGQAVRDALTRGYRHLDCAHCYNNEREVGEALKELVGEGEGKVITREQLFVTSKLWNTKHHQQDVVPALKHTLANLQLEYLDLYLIHWPHAFKRDEGFETNFPKHADGTGPVYDFEVQFTDTWRGMEEACRQGLCKSIGVSNFNSKQIEQILAMANYV